MVRGRKADVGTYEARIWINKGYLENVLSDMSDLSQEGRVRIIKAVKFGLGIKEEVKEEKEIVVPIKEKKITKKENPDNSEDEYFPPEKCYEANK
jgi:hypothetical protein